MNIILVINMFGKVEQLVHMKHPKKEKLDEKFLELCRSYIRGFTWKEINNPRAVDKIMEQYLAQDKNGYTIQLLPIDPVHFSHTIVGENAYYAAKGAGIRC